MLDFRCLILPRFVYTTGAAFDGEQIQDPEVDERLSELAERFVRISAAGVSESHPHDIMITKESPNYSGLDTFES